jgi:hypothetical protein
MARKKKKKRPGQKKATSAVVSTEKDDEEDESGDNNEGDNKGEVKQQQQKELTTAQELAKEARERRKEEKAIKAAERARKKKEKEEIAAMPGPSSLTLRHILIKHLEARNTFSKRLLAEVSKTKEDAMQELEKILEQLISVDGENIEVLEKLFADLALSRSDCGTHVCGGKLDVKRKQTHVNFEEIAWSLEIGQLANGIVETDSGCHVIMRVA